jgi:ankyrin repeat protein
MFKYQPSNRAHQKLTYYPELKVNTEGTTNIFSSILTGNIATLQEALTANQLSVNVIDENKNTLLHSVINSTYPIVPEEQKLQVVKYLVDNGISVNAVNNNLQTPLHLAARNNYSTIIAYLASKGAKVNAQDFDKKTPLHYIVANSLTNCTPYQSDKVMNDTLFDYEDVNKIEFKNVHKILAKVFEQEYFYQYFRDLANTIEINIRDDEKVIENFDVAFADIKNNVVKYSNDTDTDPYISAFNNVVNNTIKGLKKNIMESVGITNKDSDAVFKMNEDRVEAYKEQMIERFTKCRNNSLNKLSKTLNILFKDVNDYNVEYYDAMIQSTLNIEKNMEKITKINDNIGSLMAHQIHYAGIYGIMNPQEDLNLVNAYVPDLIAQLRLILVDPVATQGTAQLNLISSSITLPGDNINKRIYHISYLSQYVATMANILYDIRIKHSNDEPIQLMLKFVLPSIEFILNSILTLVKIKQYVPIVLQHNNININKIKVILQGTKDNFKRIANILDVATFTPNPGWVGDFNGTITNLKQNIKNLTKQYSVPVTEINKITSTNAYFFNKWLEKIYGDLYKYYNDLIELIHCLNGDTSNKYLFGYVDTFENTIRAENLFNKFINQNKEMPKNLDDFISEYGDQVISVDDLFLNEVVKDYIIYLDDTNPAANTDRLNNFDLSVYSTVNHQALETADLYTLNNAVRNQKEIGYRIVSVPAINFPQAGIGYLVSQLNPQLCALLNPLNFTPRCARNVVINNSSLQVNKGTGFPMVNSANIKDYVKLISYFIAEQFKDINNINVFRDRFDVARIDPNLLNAIITELETERNNLYNQFAPSLLDDNVINEIIYNIFANTALKIYNIYFESMLNKSLTNAITTYVQNLQIQQVVRPVGNELFATLKSALDKDRVFDFKKFDSDLMDHLSRPGSVGRPGLIKYETPKFINKSNTNDDNKLLSYVYDQNYNSNINHTTCTNKNALSTITELIAAGANPNIPDRANVIPLCYAISSLNLPIINALIKPRMLPSTFNHKDYKCSYNHLYKQYLFHDYKLMTLRNLKSTLIFHKPINDRMIERLISKEEYKGLVPQYIDTILPQVIIMFNHYLYDQMLSYNKMNNVAINQYLGMVSELKMNDSDIVNLLLEQQINLRRPEDIYRLLFLTSPVNINAVRMNHENDFNKYLDTKYNEEDYNKSLRTYNRRIPNYQNEHDKITINYMKDELNNYMRGLDVDIVDQRINLDAKIGTNPVVSKNTEQAQLNQLYLQYFDDIRLGLSNINLLEGVPLIYDTVFDRLNKNGKIYKELWNLNIQTPSIYSNLHLMLVKIMLYYVASNSSNNNNQLVIPPNHFNLIKNIYNEVIIDNIQPYIYRTQIYGSDNKLLNVTIDIIRHVVKTNIMTSLANLLYSQLVVYLDKKHKEDLLNNIYDVLVNDELSLKITKHVLKIYAKDDVKENDFNFMFNRFNNFLALRTASSPLINDIDKLRSRINTIIKPYFSDLLVATIEAMKLVLDNYYIYIINDQKYLQILDTMNKF